VKVAENFSQRIFSEKVAEKFSVEVAEKFSFTRSKCA
jgi:hypothetical protein